MAQSILNRIEVNAEDMKEALSLAFVDKKSTIPVLTRVLLKPIESGIRVLSTNLDLWVITDIAGESANDASILIPYAKVLGLLKGETRTAVFSYRETVEMVKSHKAGEYKDGKWVAGEEFEKEARSQNVTLEVGGVSYELQTLNTANFPVMPDIEAPQFHIPGAEFKAILSRITFAIAKKESRYTLNGMLLKSENGKLTFTATDGHRMAAEEFELSKAPKLSTIIATSALTWLAKNIGKTDIGVNAGEEYTVFSLPDIRTVLVSRKIKGQFPNYEAVVPSRKSVKHVATFPNAEELAKKLAKVAQMADDRSNAVKWNLTATCELSAQSVDRGKASASVPATVTHPDDTPDIVIGLNTAYVIDFLKVAGKNPVTISLRDNQSAALLEVQSIQNYRYVVMPMQIL